MRQAPSMLFFLVFAACNKGAITLSVGDDTGGGGADSGDPSSDDTGDSSGDDTGAGGDDTSGGEDTSPPEDTTPPEPVADTSRYSGELVFSYDSWGGCGGDTVVEEAVAVSESTAAAMKAACPSCSHFYEVTLDKSQVCSWINIEDKDYRGLSLGDGWAFVYRFTEDKGEFSADLLDSTATYDGWTVNFDSSFDYWGVEVQIVGAYTFPEAAAE